MKTAQLRKNVIGSFDNVREDVLVMRNEVYKLQKHAYEQQLHIVELYKKIRVLEAAVYNLRITKGKTPKPITKVVTKTVTKKAKKKLVASKASDKFHVDICPYAQNIKKPVLIPSPAQAAREGRTACKCV